MQTSDKKLCEQSFIKVKHNVMVQDSNKLHFAPNPSLTKSHPHCASHWVSCDVQPERNTVVCGQNLLFKAEIRCLLLYYIVLYFPFSWQYLRQKYVLNINICDKDILRGKLNLSEDRLGHTYSQCWSTKVNRRLEAESLQLGWYFLYKDYCPG